MTDEDFMRVALEQAELTLAESELPVGSVVVMDGKIIGKGRKLSSNFHLGHAEMHALQEALQGKKFFRKDNHLTLYTTLEPCVMCYGTILHCPISRVVYAFEDVYGGATNIHKPSLPTRHHSKNTEIVGGILREESKKLLKKFIETTNDPIWLNSENPLIQSINAK